MAWHPANEMAFRCERPDKMRQVRLRRQQRLVMAGFGEQHVSHA
jgi:hypothetical protein